jgi:quercetin dioxygenase-like cupin family protein
MTMDQDRRSTLTGGFAALAAIFAAVGTASAAARPGFLTKNGKAINAKRTFTDADGKTHCDTITWKATPAAAGEDSIIPVGCTRYYESPAVSMLVRHFLPGMKTDYHTDPAHEHQVTFMLAGEAAVGARDGSSFRLGPGEFAAVEDDHGEGHTAVDATGKGFTQLFVAVPAGD